AYGMPATVTNRRPGGSHHAAALAGNSVASRSTSSVATPRPPLVGTTSWPISALYSPRGTRRLSRTSSETLSFTGLRRAVHTAAPIPVTSTTLISRMPRRGARAPPPGPLHPVYPPDAEAGGLGPQPGDVEQRRHLVGHRAVAVLPLGPDV